MNNSIFVSIIIPTYHDWERLSVCIDALEKQTYPKDLYEVIIVNNDPKDKVPQPYYLPDNFQIIDEYKVGSFAARNAGLHVSKGQIVGFTDSDCIPFEDWIENAVQAFSSGETDRIAGRIELFYKRSDKKTWAETYESIYAFDQKRNVAVLKASVTANFFLKRSMFDTVGIFDESKMSAEDIDWNRRANAMNFNLVYADKVAIKHPARSTLKEIKNKKTRDFGSRKKFILDNPVDIAKNIIYLPYLFNVTVLSKTFNLFLKEKRVSVIDKCKVTGINLYIYVILVGEFFRLLFKGERVR